ncbi:GIN domain-containing protein [Winogradskyella litorisediminis]|uniref:GIN domain-containing protein n=1 Tax=Winogradskyella litorisediminis TaxID=1156618 RepID=A0ABW3N733_9FLAO
MKLNKYTYSLIFLLGIIAFANAQSKEKIKGDRNVTIKQTYLDSFHTLDIKDDFEVQLVYNSKPSVEIEADDNLHEIIDLDMVSGVLTISTQRRIASKKKLVITVNYSDELSNISLYDSAEIRSLTSLELGDVSLTVKDNSRAYLNLKSSTFKFSATEKTKSRLNITADSSSFSLSDNSKLDALVKGISSKFDLYQSSDATIEGDTEDVALRLDNSSNFVGKNYSVKNADVLIESTSDISLNVEMFLVLKASGNTETYIYGEPKIELEIFTDTAKLQKKKK